MDCIPERKLLMGNNIIIIIIVIKRVIENNYRLVYIHNSRLSAPDGVSSYVIDEQTKVIWSRISSNSSIISSSEYYVVEH